MEQRIYSFAARLGIGVLFAWRLVSGGPAPVRAQDVPIELGQGGQSLEDLTGEDEFPLQVTGFGVAGYTYDGRTSDNTFAGSKIAVALFRELSDQFWIFGQLTTLLEEPEGVPAEPDGAALVGSGSLARAGTMRALTGGARAARVASQAEGEGGVATSIEIDNLILNFTPPGAPGLSLFLGKFDDPLGFERDDEPLNLQPTTTFNFELGRPVKLVGLGARWNLGPKVNLLGMVANGWESQIDPNHGKTVGGRIGLLPTENTSLGVGGLFGPEGDPGDTHDRYLVTLDYAWQPTSRLILAGEANWGGDRDGVADGEDANWIGGTLTVFGRLASRFGITARGEVFDDRDGARTGEVQTLESFSIAPAYFIGTGRNGIFSNVEHTTFRIPRFQIRGEVRVNHSNIDAFETDSGPGDWEIQYILQLVAAL